MIPVVVIADADLAVPAAIALADGGIPCAEITLRTPAALAAIDAVASAMKHGDLPADFALGAGTVLDSSQAADAIAAGARYVVSPGLDEGVMQTCSRHDVPVVPGVATASEVQKAYNLGARLVKFFPAGTSGGIAALRALAAPFSMMQFVPTGGITMESASEWLDVPAVVAVGGSWMSPPATLATRDFDAITRVARDTVTRLGAGTAV